MKKILHIISSPRGNSSFSIKLGEAIVNKIQETYPGSTIRNYDLISKNFPHLEEHHVTSFYTPADQRSPEAIQALFHSDDAIGEIRSADIIVIGAPLYNFGIHSSLKAWIDHITRIGETFNYTENGPEGLVKGKKVYIAMSSGGIYSDGDAKRFDFVTPYLTTILGFLGMTDVTTFRVEGTGLAEFKDNAVEKGIASITLD
ncbi:NAD(P)H-dependent oxidoreductase [Mucilaginibacter sp. SMC90]|uniref:FMN-dependent NADH-azoreductase n=1 Tax=Mucilaginibacter TaxID=423349 RepID=UPI000E0D44BA|nr:MULTISPECIES: NAD(P)H-dependent oxidoreductase [Mucilaginibacter]UOE48845.1 NAD(P)H-dependent oxidoreductase [Mucilaginibacter sp. SMC90]